MKIYNLSLFLVIVMLLSITLVSAELEKAFEDQVLKTAKTGDVKFLCVDQVGSPCSNQATCNVTFSLPVNGTVIVNNQLATQVSKGIFNYTLIGNNVRTSGTYEGIAVCTDGLYTGSMSFPVVVSPSGAVNSLWALIVVIAIAFSFMIFGFYKEDIWITVIASWALVFVGLFTLINGFDVYRDWRTEAMSFLMLAVAGYVSIRSTLELVEGNI